MTPPWLSTASAVRHDLLVLAPCLPRPDGDACSQRWFYLLRFLARHFRVHLGCIASPHDGAATGRVRALCFDTCFLPRPGLRMRLRGGAQFDPALAAWAARLCVREPIGAVLACGASMGAILPTLPPEPMRGVVRVVDFVELESDQRRRHGAARRWPGAALWRRQARRLLAAERAAGAACDHALFAGAADVARFRLFAPESAHKARQLASGVDPDYYSPHILQRSPFRPGQRALVLAGPLDGPASAAAARWLASDVFAPLHAADPALVLCLAGPVAGRMDARLRALGRQPGVVVAAHVADLRPYLAHAALVLAPPGGGHAASAAVLAAMSLQKAVLGLPRSLDGLACLKVPEACAAADAPGFRARIAALLGTSAGHPETHAGTSAGESADTSSGVDADSAAVDPIDVGRAARARVLREHDWNLRLSGLPALLSGAAPLAHAG